MPNTNIINNQHILVMLSLCENGGYYYYNDGIEIFKTHIKREGFRPPFPFMLQLVLRWHESSALQTPD
jgi:hypothetical protein